MKKIIKKVKLSKLFFLIIIVLSTTIVNAQEAPLCNYLPADANGDGIVDLTDAIAILDWLFQGGLIPCLENSDINDDGRIDLTDSVRILNWLFQGGEDPINLNEPVELSFGVVMKEEDLTEPEIFGEIPTFTIETMPNYLPVIDTSEDTILNIHQCSAFKKEVVAGADIEELFFQTEWLDNPNFVGNDIKTQTLNIPISLDDFQRGTSYKVRVICRDNQGYENEITAILNIGQGDEEDGADEEGPLCPADSAICCQRQFANGDVENYCFPVDPLDPDSDQVAELFCEPPEFQVPNDFCEPQTPPERQEPLASKNQKREVQFLGDASPEPEPTPEPNCEVEEMTILKTGDSIPGGFTPPQSYTRKTHGEQLGHTEGWMAVPKFYYRFGFEFVVLAFLKEGSVHTECAEHQFVQTTQTVIKDSIPKKTTYYILGYMFEKEDLLKKTKLLDLEAAGKLGTHEIIEKKRNKNYEVSGEIPPELRHLFPDDFSGCEIGKNLYCDDKYDEEYGSPGKIREEWTVFAKKYDNVEGKPRIIWFDAPGSIVGSLHIRDGRSTIENPPWSKNTGGIYEEIFKAIEKKFIMILEGTNEERWVCLLGDARSIHFRNDVAGATNTKKAQLVEEPSCKCFKQKWDKDGNEWKDLPGEENENNCGPIS